MQLQSFYTYIFKKLTIIIILQFIVSLPAFAKFGTDTSYGIYFTKEQFEKNELQLKSCYWIRTKGPLLWSDFAYESNSPIKIKVSKDDIKTFELGSIYGFKKNGVKFIYVKSLNEYLAVLNENPASLFLSGRIFFIFIIRQNEFRFCMLLI